MVPTQVYSQFLDLTPNEVIGAFYAIGNVEIAEILRFFIFCDHRRTIFGNMVKFVSSIRQKLSILLPNVFVSLMKGFRGLNSITFVLFPLLLGVGIFFFRDRETFNQVNHEKLIWI